MGAGKQVALGAQRVAGAVKPFHQIDLAPGVCFKQHLRNVQPQRCGHVHHRKLPRRQVRGVASVLQFGQPQRALVLKREFGAFAPRAGGVAVLQVADGTAGGGGVFQFLDVGSQFVQRVRLPGQFVGDVMAHLDGSHAVWRAKLQQFQGRQRAVVPGVQAVGPVTRGHGVSHHARQPAVFQHGNAAGFAREAELQGVQGAGGGRVDVGVLVAEPALARVNVQVCGQHGLGGARQPGPDGCGHF